MVTHNFVCRLIRSRFISFVLVKDSIHFYLKFLYYKREKKKKRKKGRTKKVKENDLVYEHLYIFNDCIMMSSITFKMDYFPPRIT